MIVHAEYCNFAQLIHGIVRQFTVTFYAYFCIFFHVVTQRYDLPIFQISDFRTSVPVVVILQNKSHLILISDSFVLIYVRCILNSLDWWVMWGPRYQYLLVVESPMDYAFFWPNHFWHRNISIRRVELVDDYKDVPNRVLPSNLFNTRRLPIFLLIQSLHMKLPSLIDISVHIKFSNDVVKEIFNLRRARHMNEFVLCEDYSYGTRTL